MNWNSVRWWTKIFCTGPTIRTNQPRKDPFHLFSLSSHSPQFQQSALATSLISLVVHKEDCQHFIVFQNHSQNLLKLSICYLLFDSIPFAIDILVFLLSFLSTLIIYNTYLWLSLQCICMYPTRIVQAQCEFYTSGLWSYDILNKWYAIKGTCLCFRQCPGTKVCIRSELFCDGRVNCVLSPLGNYVINCVLSPLGNFILNCVLCCPLGKYRIHCFLCPPGNYIDNGVVVL